MEIMENKLEQIKLENELERMEYGKQTTRYRKWTGRYGKQIGTNAMEAELECMKNRLK